MKHLYSVFGSYVEPDRHEALVDFGMVRTALSKQNRLAFTSHYNIFLKRCDLGFYVYVIDLNLPHIPYIVTLPENKVSVLEWDESGRKLLICDQMGKIEVYEAGDTISDWKRIFYEEIHGEIIRAASWFSTGSKFMFDSDKTNLLLPYHERLVNQFYEPTVYGYGKKPASGIVMVTQSSRVIVIVFFEDNTFVNCHANLWSFDRVPLSIVDITMLESGHCILACSRSLSGDDIRVVRFKVSIESEIDIITNKRVQKPSVSFDDTSMISLKQSIDHRYDCMTVKHVKFLKSHNSLIVSMDDASKSQIEVWNMLEGSANKPQFVFGASRQTESRVTSIGVVNRSMFSHEHLFDSIMIAQEDLQLKCFSVKDLQPVCEATNMENFVNKFWHNPEVGREMSHSVLNDNQNDGHVFPLHELQFSWSNSIAVGVDIFSQVHVFGMTQLFSRPMEYPLAQQLFEYAIVSGSDFWDVLVQIKIPMMETLFKKIQRSFTDPMSSVVSKRYSQRLQHLKIAFYRCLFKGNLPGGFNCKSADCEIISMVEALTEWFNRLFKTSLDTKDCENPFERLRDVLINNFNTNIDTVLNQKMIDLNDFVISPEILSGFCHTLQWLFDLILCTLSTIPLYDQNDNREFKLGFLNDKDCVKNVRQIVLLVRCWSLDETNKYKHLPKIQMKQNVDVYALMFRLLTKLIVLPDTATNLDEAFLEECKSISRNMELFQLDTIPLSVGVSNPVIMSSERAFKFFFSYNPGKSFNYEVNQARHNRAARMFYPCRTDRVRFFPIGAVDNKSYNIRSCNRCHAVSMIDAGEGIVARTWEAQWNKHCQCGGIWRKQRFEFLNEL